MPPLSHWMFIFSGKRQRRMDSLEPVFNHLFINSDYTVSQNLT